MNGRWKVLRSLVAATVASLLGISGAAAQSGNPIKVGGHVYYFVFGDTKTTTVNRSTYETIAESIRVRV